MAEEQEVKKENFASVEEAIKGAGSTVLSHLESRSHKLTVEEVEQHMEENPQEVIGYRGPYTDLEDARNSWTFAQDTDAITPALAQLRDKREEESREKSKERRPS